MDCVLVAGGRPGPDDPLFGETRGEPKALLDINGRPIVDYVVQALLGARSVNHIVLVGLDKNIGNYPGDRLTFVADKGSLVANGLAGLAELRWRRSETEHVLFCSADIPAVKSDHVESLVAACGSLDKAAYYFMVKREAIEKHFPGSSRTYVSLKGIQVAGADMFVADARLADGNTQLLHALAAGRKHPWKLARIVGPTTLLALWSRGLSLAGIERRAEEVISQPVSVQLTECAQLAMDIDKPVQLQLLRQYLTKAEP